MKNKISMNDLKPITFKTFSGVLTIAKQYATRPSRLRSWMFRGQENAKWHLETILERQLKDFELPLNKAPDLEKGFLRKFRRHCNNYIQNPPDWGNIMEWFALMRHYGAPTRLLDCTYSVFVALFFAVEKSKGDFALWAFDAKGIEQKAYNKLNSELSRLMKPSSFYDPNLQLHEDFEKVFGGEKEKFVIPMNPYKFNERLVIQQGVFLCPGRISNSFEDNITNLFDSKEELNKYIKKYVFKFNINLKKKILYYLQRMNMNRATLFPGLEGFSESLNSYLAFPDVTKVLPKDSDYVTKRYTSKVINS